MNLEQLITIASDAIEKQTNRAAKNYWLILRRGELLCVPATCLHHDDLHVFLLTSRQLCEGLTSQEWQYVGEKLLKFYKELRI